MTKEISRENTILCSRENLPCTSTVRYISTTKKAFRANHQKVKKKKLLTIITLHVRK
jgi:hypothetical protein